MFKGCEGRVCDARSVQSPSCWLPRFVCHQVRWEKVEVAVSMTSERRTSGICSERRLPNCVLDHSLDARFGCDEGHQMCRFALF